MRYRDYRIVKVYTSEALESEVRRLGKDGWVALGGASVCGNDWFMQTLALPYEDFNLAALQDLRKTPAAEENR